MICYAEWCLDLDEFTSRRNIHNEMASFHGKWRMISYRWPCIINSICAFQYYTLMSANVINDGVLIQLWLPNPGTEVSAVGLDWLAHSLYGRAICRTAAPRTLAWISLSMSQFLHALFWRKIEIIAMQDVCVRRRFPAHFIAFLSIGSFSLLKMMSPRLQQQTWRSPCSFVSPGLIYEAR